MDRERYSRMREVVDAAFGADDPVARATELCAGDAELLADVLPLLGAEEGGLFSDDALERRRAEIDAALGASDEPWVPERIGEYRVEGVLGRGGTGVVFLARQSRPDRAVALKLLHPGLATESTIARLAREADVLGRLNHPGIAQIHGAGSADVGFGDQPYLAMEWVDGVDIVSFARPLGRDERVRLLVRVADAVEHAHARGIVHRDLKPDNVLVTADGGAKVVDFGIAALADGVERLTLDATVLGTLAYMAPEQASGGAGALSPAVDVFALGAIAFEVLTGRRPRDLDGRSATAALTDVGRAPVPAARSVAPDLPRDLATILDHALELIPRDRYGSVAGLRADLERYLAHRPILARRPSALDRTVKAMRRHPGLAFGAFTTVGALGLGLVVAVELARRAHVAEGDAVFQRYAAEMRIATAQLVDPSIRMRVRATVERWAPGAPLAERAMERTGLRWEWHLVDSVRRERRVVLDCGGGPTAVHWHPDGERIAVATLGSVVVADARDGRALQRLARDADDGGGILFDARWDPTGTLVAAVTDRATLLWEPLAGPKPLWWRSSPSAMSLGWEPDGEGFLAARPNGARWSLDGAQHATLDAGPRPLPTRPHWNADGTAYLDTEPYSGLAWVNAATGERTRLSVEWTGVGTTLALDPTDRALALANREGEVAVWDLERGERRFVVQLADQPVFGLAWDSGGERIAAAVEDGSLCVLDGRTGAVLDVLSVHDGPPRTVDWSPDDRYLASTAWGGLALVHDTAERGAVRRRQVLPFEPAGGEGQLTADVDGRILVAGTLTKAVRIDPRADVVRTPTVATDGTLRVSPDGALVAAAGSGHRLVVRPNSAAPRTESVIELGGDTWLFFDWLPPGHGPGLVGASKDGVWRVDVGDDLSLTETLVHTGGVQVMELRVAPDASAAAVVLTDGTLRLVPLDGRREASTLPIDGAGPRCVGWDPTSTRIAVGCQDTHVRVVDVATGSVERVLRGHAAPVSAVGWHPSGDRIATGAQDRQVMLWDPAAEIHVGTIPLGEHIHDVLWLGRGDALAVLGRDGGLLLLDASRSLGRARGERATLGE